MLIFFFFHSNKFSKKSSGRVRLVKAVDPSYRGIGSVQQVLYTLSKRKVHSLSLHYVSVTLCIFVCFVTCVSLFSGHEEHLIPYSLVHPVQVQTKRPVIFSPSLLSRGLIERLLQPADSGLNFNTCPPGTSYTHTYRSKSQVSK